MVTKNIIWTDEQEDVYCTTVESYFDQHTRSSYMHGTEESHFDRHSSYACQRKAS